MILSYHYVIQNEVTALILASENGKGDVVDTLLQNNAEVNAQSTKVSNIFVQLYSIIYRVLNTKLSYTTLK